MIRVISYILQIGALHITNAVLKEWDRRHKTVYAPLDFLDQQRFYLYSVHAFKIRFKSIHSQEVISKAQLVNFHRLTPKGDFILIPFLRQ